MYKSYWEKYFRDNSEVLIVYLMERLGINHIDFNADDLDCHDYTDKRVFIGKINDMESDQAYRLSILHKDTNVIGGDID